MPHRPSAATPILFAGDPHGRFDHLLTAVRAHRPAALILLGDIEAPVPLQQLMAPIEALGTPVWFIPGNHDTDRAQSWTALQAWPERNLHGRVVEIAGLRVAGLGGIFRDETWRPDNPMAPSFDSLQAYVAHVRLRTHPKDWALLEQSPHSPAPCVPRSASPRDHWTHRKTLHVVRPRRRLRHRRHASCVGDRPWEISRSAVRVIDDFITKVSHRMRRAAARSASR